MFWSTTRPPSPDDLSQEWILDGFKKSLDGFFILQGDSGTIDQEGKSQEDLLYISPKFIHMTGFTDVQKHITDLDWWREKIHPEDKNRLINYINARRLGESDQKQIEYRFQHRAGHWIWLLTQTHVHHPDSDTRGSNKGWIMGSITNITSYRVLQDQLERTIEEAELTSQAKSKFIASLNHELRTPLNGIIGMSNFLTESTLSTEQLEYVENIAASAQLLLSLVNDILDVSKITAGKLTLEEHEFDLNRHLHRTTSLLKPLFQLKKLEFELSIDKNVPKWVLGDQVRLQQIITNLINNAVKFTETGKITLLVQLRDSAPRENPEEVLVLFKVIDTGTGIPAHVLPKLFQDFTQADSSVTRTHGGTGLGLSICKKLVTLMHGEIGAQSTLGKGSTFWFSVPYLPVEAQDSEEASSIPRPQKDISQIQILVAEDNLINQQVIKGLIQNLGGQTTIAHNGQEAVDKFTEMTQTQAGFDLIFMDINMPVMDGYEATTILRNLPHGINIPIIACTADTVTHSKAEFLEKGFTDIIAKPINKQDLSDCIQRYAKESLAQKGHVDISQGMTSEKSPPSAGPIVVDSLINIKVVDALREDIGSEVVDTLLATYKVDAKIIVDQLVQEESIQETHNLAHALAGISENLGLQAVGKISRSLMIATHDALKNKNMILKNDKELLEMISQLQSQFEASVEAIDTLS